MLTDRSGPGPDPVKASRNRTGNRTGRIPEPFEFDPLLPNDPVLLLHDGGDPLLFPDQASADEEELLVDGAQVLVVLIPKLENKEFSVSGLN